MKIKKLREICCAAGLMPNSSIIITFFTFCALIFTTGCKSNYEISSVSADYQQIFNIGSMFSTEALRVQLAVIKQENLPVTISYDMKKEYLLKHNDMYMLSRKLSYVLYNADSDSKKEVKLYIDLLTFYASKAVILFDSAVKLDDKYDFSKEYFELGNMFYNCGVLYENKEDSWIKRLLGTGPDKYYLKAIQQYRKAASSGNFYAMRFISEMNKKGQGIRKNQFEADKWAFEAALAGAEKGDKDSMLLLAEIYKNGIGTKKDLEQSEKWIKKAKHAKNIFKTQFNLDTPLKDPIEK